MIDITQIVVSLIGLAVGAFTAFVLPLIRSMTTASQREAVRFWVSVAVNAAEQRFAGFGRGSEKKLAVVEFLEKKGFTLDTDELDALIEAEVAKLK